MSDKNNDRNRGNEKPQNPQEEPLIKGDVPDFEHTPPPPKTDKESD